MWTPLKVFLLKLKETDNLEICCVCTIDVHSGVNINTDGITFITYSDDQ